ncbi:FUSC family protein [Gordonia sp. CPCC 205515]|uniref:FUSC family protein n=1 Tax=Gordonia sp. CPCC 205515 TaxID=3140791 RepID=UPI003AF3395E
MPKPAPPPRPAIRRMFFAVPDVRGRWGAAIRSGLAFALPALVLYGAGFGRDALLVALGGFAMLYGEKRPYRVRWRVIATASVVLAVVATGYGYLGAWAGADATVGENLVVVAALSIGAGVVVFAVNAMRLGPPGPFFFVLVAAIATVVTRHGVAPSVLATCAAAGAVASLVVGMAPALWSPRGPESAATHAAMAAVETYLADNRGADPARRHGVALSTLHAWSVLHDSAQTDSALAQQLWMSQHRFHDAAPTTTGPWAPPLPRPSVAHRLIAALHWQGHATVTTIRVVVTAAVAGGLSLALGLSRPDWAILGTVLVLQLGPDRIRGSLRGAHRLVGTILGLVAFTLLHLLDLQVIALILVIAALNVLIELTIVGNYAVAVTFITPLAMLMGNPEGALFIPVRDRFLETLLGVALAVAALWLLLPHAHRRSLHLADGEVLAACEPIVDPTRRDPVGSPPLQTARRDLQWALLESEMAATDSASDEPYWAREQWPHHLTVVQIGYDTLGACWRTGPGHPIGNAVADELTDRIVRVR